MRFAPLLLLLACQNDKAPDTATHACEDADWRIDGEMLVGERIEFHTECPKAVWDFVQEIEIMSSFPKLRREKAKKSSSREYFDFSIVFAVLFLIRPVNMESLVSLDCLL